MKGPHMRATALYQGIHPRGTPARGSRSAWVGPKKGIFRRIFAAIERSRQRYIEKQVARFIAARGGRITDDVERQLNERFAERGFPPYA
jgi:hypothetical protein